MARIDTDKPINPSQLGVELGRIPIRYVEGVYVAADVDEPVLQSAVDTHTADPAWVDPNPPAVTPTRDEIVRAKGIEGFRDLVALAKDTSQTAIVRRIARDTAWGLRALYTELRDEVVE